MFVIGALAPDRSGMDADTRWEKLLGDAFGRVRLSPEASAPWHALLEAYDAVDDPNIRVLTQRMVADQAPTDGVAGFLRASFLSGLEDGDAFAAEAGAALEAIRPVDLDRLMAFAGYEWGRAVAREGGRARFARRLIATRLPQLMAMAGEVLAEDAVDLPVRPIDGVKRVALVTPFLSFAGHPPTVLALKQAGLLQAAGLTVKAFACQEPLIPGMRDYLGNRGEILAAPPDLRDLAALAPAGLTISLGDAAFPLHHRWRETLREIGEFDPDLILFVGLFSPLITPLHKVRPVLGLSIHAVTPMAPVDAWLTSDPHLADRALTPWGNALPPAWGIHHPFRVSLRPRAWSITRDQLEVGPDDLVLVSVGARLDAEIGGEWAARMVALMESRPDIVWMLVGGGGALPQALSVLPEHRIRRVPHQEDIRAVLACCDVFVNPARLGGGFSVAEAMAEGVAVCALADSDGGDKLGGYAVVDLTAYFELLSALLDDPARRRGLGESLRARFFASLDLDRSGPSLLAACQTTLDRFSRRGG